ncbi:MAG: hypothetical protein LBU82_07765 [Treponema sp.]|jgi:hypothetical protein|nr:hypothetical protein [Treponema sp.]
MPAARKLIMFCLFFLSFHSGAESFRAIITNSLEVTSEQTAGSAATLGINGSTLIDLGDEKRFFRGIELEISAPQAWLSYRGSLVMEVYSNLNVQTASGVTDLEGSRIAFEPLPGKINTVYHIPMRPSHGLRTTPYVTVPTGVTPPDSFPILFRLIPVVKGINDELETMIFTLTVRPILSAEGAVTLVPRYPPQLRGKPFTVLIDDAVIENPSEPQLLKEGEHHLVVLSQDYRNESRRFVVERAKTIQLILELQDPTPIIIFEGPENARIFLNSTPIPRNRQPVAVEPGAHEAKFVIGDYTIIKNINVQRGKTYRVALNVDLTIDESD